MENGLLAGFGRFVSDRHRTGPATAIDRLLKGDGQMLHRYQSQHKSAHTQMNRSKPKELGNFISIFKMVSSVEDSIYRSGWWVPNLLHITT